MKTEVAKLEIFAAILLFCLIVYFPVFLHIDTLPIRVWDEARLAINAIEMSEGGSLLVPTFQNAPDMWNTKPPLMIWLQVISIKLLGNGELAIRIPSAIAAFLTCFIIFIFCDRKFGSLWLGLIAAAILVTSNGYIDEHAARTGDYDSLLTLFTTLYCLSFFSALTTRDRIHNWSLFFFFFFLALAVLTKSIAGLLFVPALVVFTVAKKKLNLLLKSKSLYLGFLLFILMVGSYYGIREVYNPGYLKAVIDNELGGRYLETLEGHQHGFWYYFQNLYNYKFTFWLLFLPVGISIGIAKDKFKVFSLFLVSLILSYFLIISFSQTKLEWYDVPLYPLMSILAAIGIYEIVLASKNIVLKKYYQTVVPVLLTIAIFYHPYKGIIDKVYKPQEYPWHVQFYQLSNYLKDAVENKKQLQGSILHEGYHGHLLFYQYVLNKQGSHIRIQAPDQVLESDALIIHQDNIQKLVEAKYKAKLIEEKENVKVFVVKADYE